MTESMLSNWGSRSPLMGSHWRDTLRAAEVHYYRIPRERWELMILRAEQSGANVISTYVPWSHHAPSPEVLDFTGETSPRRDLVSFLALVAERGLGLIVKPGPFVDSEIIGGGVPPWLIGKHPELWVHAYDGRVMVHSDSQDPRLSYDAPDHHALAGDWLREVMRIVQPYEGSALVAVQVDNETPGDGMLIHEDDIDPSPFRADYASPDRWAAWYRQRHGAVDVPEQPTRWQVPTGVDDLQLLADVDRYADHQLKTGLSATAAALRSTGYSGLLFHDWLCMRWQISGMLIDPGVMADTCGWVGQNVYAEDVDDTAMIAGTDWYRMSMEEYVHHAWWRQRLCHTLSGGQLPRFIPEISAREGFYLHCHLIGGLDAPCIYMMHTSQDEPSDIGAGQRWAMEAPITDDGTPRRHWANMRTLFHVLQAGGEDLVSSALPAPVAIAYAHEGEHTARWAGAIPGAPWSGDDELKSLAAASNASAAGNRAARALVDRGIEFDVVDVTRNSLEGYRVVVVPDLEVFAGDGIDALVSHARSGGVLAFAGAVPEWDVSLRPRADLGDVTKVRVEELVSTLDPPAAVTDIPRTADSGCAGVDVSCRTGDRARYLTLVNRRGSAFAGDVRLAGGQSIVVATDHGTVAWARIESDGTVSAAMVDGAPGRAGDLSVSQGLASIVRREGGWDVITADRTDVFVPTAAGLPVWRVMLDGRILDCGEVDGAGCIHCLPEDDAGLTDRYVLGDRALADEAVSAVTAFVETSWRESDSAINHLAQDLTNADDPDLVDLRTRLGNRDLGELAKSLARLRSRIHAGTADADIVAAHEQLTSIATRILDLELGRT